MTDNALIPVNPAELGYPPLLPVEIVLKTASIKDLCASYGLSKADWDELKDNVAFRAHVEHLLKEVKKHGMSFKLKAMLQSEELLKTSWTIIHDQDAPHNVRADLIKNTWKVAGLDASRDQNGGAGIGGAGLQINIQFNRHTNKTVQVAA